MLLLLLLLHKAKLFNYKVGPQGKAAGKKRCLYYSFHSTSYNATVKKQVSALIPLCLPSISSYQSH